MIRGINADQTSGTNSSSMGGGTTSGSFTSMKRPSATSVNTRLIVSSVLPELTCSLCAARITVADSRNRFPIFRPAEYTNLDLICDSSSVVERLLQSRARLCAAGEPVLQTSGSVPETQGGGRLKMAKILLIPFPPSIRSIGTVLLIVALEFPEIDHAASVSTYRQIESHRWRSDLPSWRVYT